MRSHLILILSLTLLACAGPKKRKSWVVRADPPASPRENQEKSDSAPKSVRNTPTNPLHDPSFERRQSALKSQLRRLKAGPERDLALLYKSDGWEFRGPQFRIPESCQEAIERIWKRCQKQRDRSARRLEQEILNRLQDSQCPIRPTLALVLAQVPGDRSFQSLVNLAQDKDWKELARAALAALGQRPEKLAALALIRALTDAELTLTAARSLKSIHRRHGFSYEIEESVLKALSEPNQSGASRRVLMVLAADLHIYSAAPLICQFLSDSYDLETSILAAKTLSEFKSQFVLNQLRASAQDPRPRVRAHVIDGLAAHKDSLSRDLVYRLAEQDKHAQVRRSALLALAAFGDDSADQLILKNLDSRLPQIRIAAFQAAIKLELNEARDKALKGLRGQSSLEERLVCIACLGHFKDRRAIPSLKQHLTSKNFFIRRESARALCDMASPDSLSAIAELFRDSEIKRNDPEIVRLCLRQLRPQKLARQHQTLCQQLLALAKAPKQRPIIQAAAIATAYRWRLEGSQRLFRRLGDQTMTLMKSKLLKERERAVEQLRELSDQGLKFSAEASSRERYRQSQQIEQWWAWKRDRLP